MEEKHYHLPMTDSEPIITFNEALALLKKAYADYMEATAGFRRNGPTLTNQTVGQIMNMAKGLDIALEAYLHRKQLCINSISIRLRMIEMAALTAWKQDDADDFLYVLRSELRRINKKIFSQQEFEETVEEHSKYFGVDQIRVHNLKVWPEYFDSFPKKTFEVRKADRDFRVNDFLWLRKWEPEIEYYTGAARMARVTYRLDGGKFGIEEGYCVLGLDFHYKWANQITDPEKHLV
jgi:hypothetical protein